MPNADTFVIVLFLVFGKAQRLAAGRGRGLRLGGGRGGRDEGFRLGGGRVAFGNVSNVEIIVV